MIRQSEYQCLCGSWWHNDGKCKCGRTIKINESYYTGKIEAYDPTKKPSRGTGWDKKRHKVIWK